MEVDFSYTSNWAPFDGSYRETSMPLNDNRPKEVPRFCEIIFQFRENSASTRPYEMLYTDVHLGVDIY